VSTNQLFDSESSESCWRRCQCQRVLWFCNNRAHYAVVVAVAADDDTVLFGHWKGSGNYWPLDKSACCEGDRMGERESE